MSLRNDEIEIERRPHLRAIEGGCQTAAEGVLPEVRISRAATRAGDRHDPWTFVASPALRQLADAAAAAGVDFELAMRIVVEGTLAEWELRSAGVDPALLDATAARACAGAQLDDAARAYLRRLTAGRGAVAPDADAAVGGDGASAGACEMAADSLGGTAAAGGDATPSPIAPRAFGDAVTVGLPVRLSGRLLRVDLDALIASADVERALAWEVAALLDGRTISEWAPLVALRAGALQLVGA
jgi:hypothetical protein